MSALTPLRILYVEDLEDDAALVTVALKRAGYAVDGQRVTTAAEMQAALQGADWDAVIADHTLPAFSAPAALAVLQQLELDLPFIIVSGTMNEVEAVAALRAGAHDFVTKGNLSRLAPALERELRDAENRRQRRRAEAALRETEARFSQVWETTSDAMALSDANGLILAANPAYYALYGYTSEQVLGQTFALIFPEEQRAQAIEQYKGVFANPEPPGVFETAIQRGDGTERFVESRATFITRESRRTAMLSTIRDVTERKRAEEALRASAERLRATMDAMREGMQIISFDWRYLYVNDAAEAQNRQPREAILGRTMLEANPGFELTTIFAALKRAMERRQPERIEEVYVFPDGSAGWFDVSAQPVPDGILVLSQDITERKRAEGALQQAEAKYRTLIEQIPAITYVAALDETSSTLYISPQIEKLGYTAAEHLADPSLWAQVIHPDDRERVLTNVTQTTQTSRPLRSEYRVRDRAGRTFWVRDEATIVTDADGRPLFLQGVMVDITEQRQADQALRASEERQRLIVDTALDGVITIDSASVITGWNPLAEKIFGWPRAEALGQRLYELIIPHRYRDAHQRGLAHFLATGEASVLNTRIEVTALHRAGHEFAVELSISPVPVGEGFTFSAFARDITERKQAEARIQRQVEYLTALRDIDRAIISSFDLNLSLTLLLAQVTARLGVDAAAILVFNEVTQMLEQIAARGFRPRAIEHARLRLGEGYAGRAALEHRVLHVPDLRATGDNPRLAQALAADSFAGYYAVPLLAKGQVRGVLEVFQRPLPDGTAAGPADPEWLDFMETLAGQAAIAIDNAALFANLQRSNLELALAYDATIEGWSRALDLRDKETEGHSRRVTELTLRLAEAMRLGADELPHIRRGALLHDMGKLGVPDHILLKPELLTADEWVIMRQHPTFAYELLSPISFLRPALDIPYCHHEKWDGTGYPRKLKGEQIPLAARLFSVVDVWDALSSDRPYRPAWSKDRVLAHIRSLAGSAFDQRVVEAFLSLID